MGKQINMTKNCYCGALIVFESCCEPFIIGNNHASTAEVLMRSRYSAFATQQADYLVTTTHRAERTSTLKKDVLEWSIANHWQKLEVVSVTSTTVEFKAYYLDYNKKPQIHHELSTFIKEDGLWYYVDGSFF
jgi:SEC-C motif-containing protein